MDAFTEAVYSLPLAEFDVGSFIVLFIIVSSVCSFVAGCCIFAGFDFVKSLLTLRKRIARDVLKLLALVDHPVTLRFVIEYCDLEFFHVKRYYDLLYSLVYDHNCQFGSYERLEDKETLLFELSHRNKCLK